MEEFLLPIPLLIDLGLALILTLMDLLTGKGRLRWGEQSTQVFSTSKLVSIYPDNDGWVLSINRDLMTDMAAEKTKGDVRAAAGIFAKSFDSSLSMGLEKMLLRDKFTFAKDPYWTGRALVSAIMIINYAGAISFHRAGDIFFVALMLFSMAVTNINKNNKELLC